MPLLSSIQGIAACIGKGWMRSGILLVCLAASLGISIAVAEGQAGQEQLERGRYLIKISGCNDCHTPGYPESGGQVDERLWLTGSSLGWRGPWGTTYAANLRLLVPRLSEAEWLNLARTPRRPPMPWFNLRDMQDADLLAIYRYLQHLGEAGQKAPAYVPPTHAPQGPFVQFPTGP